MNDTGMDLAALGIVLGFLAIVIGMVFWAYFRKYQLRNETIHKLIESGQSIDPETLDKLLADPWASPSPASRKPDPRDGYRAGGFMHFLIGFGTLVFAFMRPGVLSYPLIALGLFPIVLAFLAWHMGDREFREGTLPTLKYERDPREPYQWGGFVLFLIGYGTAFVGIIRSAGLSYPVIGLGVFAIIMGFGVWSAGDREYREGRLTGSPPSREQE